MLQAPVKTKIFASDQNEHTDMMLSDRLATSATPGFKVARLFTISDRLMVVVYGMSSNFGRKRSPNSFAVSGYTALTGQLVQSSGGRDLLDLVLGQMANFQPRSLQPLE